MNNKRIHADSVVFSFGLLNDTVRVDTARSLCNIWVKDRKRAYL
ncbi:MAG: hypothetical protein ACLU4J_03655 [Butyricimonas paravirosa]